MDAVPLTRVALLDGFALDCERAGVRTAVDDLPRGAQRLIAHLSLCGRPARGAIAGQLWPDVPEGHAHGSLRSALWRGGKGGGGGGGGWGGGGGVGGGGGGGGLEGRGGGGGGRACGSTFTSSARGRGGCWIPRRRSSRCPLQRWDCAGSCCPAGMTTGSCWPGRVCGSCGCTPWRCWPTG